jgi:hypothetical protein
VKLSLNFERELCLKHPWAQRYAPKMGLISEMGQKRIEKQKEKTIAIVPTVSSPLSIWSFPVLIPTFFYDDLKFWECPEGGKGNNRTIEERRKEEGRRKKEEGRRKKEEGRRKKKEEGRRRKKEEGRRKKKEEGRRRKKEEGRRKKKEEEGRRKKEEGRRKQ